MARKLDLDARRAEAQGEPPEVLLGGITYTLPPEFPLMAGEHLSNGAVSAAVAILFGRENVDPVAGLLTADDMNAIVEDLYDTAPEGRVVKAPENGNRAQRRAAARS